MQVILLLSIYLVVTANVCRAVETHVKILVSPMEPHLQRYLRQSTLACQDNQLLPRDSVQGKPTGLRERVRFYQSETASQGIADFVSNVAMVPGLNIPVSDVLNELKNRSCPVYIYGGVVRDLFLAKTPNDVDAKVGCDVETIHDICQDKWTALYCTRSMPATNVNLIKVGKKGEGEAVDLTESDQLYGNVTDLEYTANAIAFDYNGNNLLYDLTGSGVEDVCNKSIRIPSDDNSNNISSWDRWRIGNYMKLYRYWKLRFKSFTAYTNATRDYIVSQVKALIREDEGVQFKSFYCNQVYGSKYIKNANACAVTNQDICSANEAKAVGYNMVLTEDMGGDYLQSLMLPNCTTTPAAAKDSRSATEASIFLVFFCLTLLYM